MPEEENIQSKEGKKAAEAEKEVIKDQVKDASLNEPQEDDEKKGEEVKPEEEVIEEEMTTLHERTIATLSYMGPLAIIPFYLKKDSKFCKFHGKQGLLITVILFLSMLAWVIDVLMDFFLLLQLVIFMYMGVFGALAGKWKKCPWVYEKACLFEKALTLKSEDEEAEEEAFKPDQVGSNETVK